MVVRAFGNHTCNGIMEFGVGVGEAVQSKHASLTNMISPRRARFSNDNINL